MRARRLLVQGGRAEGLRPGRGYLLQQRLRGGRGLRSHRLQLRRRARQVARDDGASRAEPAGEPSALEASTFCAILRFL